MERVVEATSSRSCCCSFSPKAQRVLWTALTAIAVLGSATCLVVGSLAMPGIAMIAVGSGSISVLFIASITMTAMAALFQNRQRGAHRDVPELREHFLGPHANERSLSSFLGLSPSDWLFRAFRGCCSFDFEHIVRGKLAQFRAIGAQHIFLDTLQGEEVSSLFFGQQQFREQLRALGGEFCTITDEEGPIPYLTFPQERNEEIKRLKNNLLLDQTDYIFCKDRGRFYGVERSLAYRLNAALEHPEFLPKPAQKISDAPHVGTVVISFEGNVSYLEARRFCILQYLLMGFNVMVYDPPGRGLSRGTYSESAHLRSLEACGLWLQSQGIEEREMLFYGRCLGGTIGASMGSRFPHSHIWLDQAPLTIARMYDFRPSCIVRRFFNLDIGQGLRNHEGRRICTYGMQDEMIKPAHMDAVVQSVARGELFEMEFGGHLSSWWNSSSTEDIQNTLGTFMTLDGLLHRPAADRSQVHDG